MTVVVVS